MRVDVTYGQTSPPLEPVDDDQATRNDVTVTRQAGSSARVVAETGPLSVQPPPDGVGRYDEQVDLDAASDDQLPSLAGWRVHLGTWDEARWPTVTLDLGARPELVDAVTALDSGDRLVITGPPPFLPPADIDLLVQGYTETLGSYEWTVELTTTPYGPYRVGQLPIDPTDADEAELARLDTAGCELATGVDVDDTSLVAATTVGPPWTTDPDDLPFRVTFGGEEAIVIEVSGEESPQTLTVIRSVNGIVKAHAAGTPISLARPVVIGL